MTLDYKTGWLQVRELQDAGAQLLRLRRLLPVPQPRLPPRISRHLQPGVSALPAGPALSPPGLQVCPLLHGRYFPHVELLQPAVRPAALPHLAVLLPQHWPGPGGLPAPGRLPPLGLLQADGLRELHGLQQGDVQLLRDGVPPQPVRRLQHVAAHPQHGHTTELRGQGNTVR